jgi:hypothetical protein
MKSHQSRKKVKAKKTFKNFLTSTSNNSKTRMIRKINMGKKRSSMMSKTFTSKMLTRTKIILMDKMKERSSFLMSS